MDRSPSIPVFKTLRATSAARGTGNQGIGGASPGGRLREEDYVTAGTCVNWNVLQPGRKVRNVQVSNGQGVNDEDHKRVP